MGYKILTGKNSMQKAAECIVIFIMQRSWNTHSSDYENSECIQRTSEMLAGVLGGMKAVATWLIILACVIAGVVILGSMSRGVAPLLMLSGLGIIAGGVFVAALLCGLTAMLFVIMKQSRYQSWALRQMLNRQIRLIELLEAQTPMKRINDPTKN